MSASRSRRSMGEPDYTSSLYSEPPAPLSSVNPIMDALKEGVLKLRSKYRDFTLLLDLQKGYHHHFMTRLFDHVKEVSQFSWDNLEWDGDARRACAESFLEKYGMQYWGEKNRKKCLMAESLENPGELCTYPERKEEITRIIMLLIEKKVKTELKEKRANVGPKSQDVLSDTKAQESGLKPSHPPTNPPLLILKPDNPQAKAKSTNTNHDKDESGGKRRTSDSPDPFYVRQKERRLKKSKKPKTENNEDDSNMLPPSKIGMLPERPIPKPVGVLEPEQKAQKHAAQGSKQMKVNDMDDMDIDEILEAPLFPRRDRSIGNQSTATPTQSSEERRTSFLVTATSQPGMAPVFVPFQNFPTASAFIESMTDECGLHEWDPSTQLTREMSNSFSPAAAMRGVIAASVELKWSGFSIRVRPDKNRDWEILVEKIRKEWSNRDQNNQSNSATVDNGSEGNIKRDVGDLEIVVMLHVVG